MANLNDTLSKVENWVFGKDKELEGLKEKAASLSVELETANSKSKEFSDKLVTVEASLVAKDEAIKTLNAEIVTLKASVTEVEKSNAAKIESAAAIKAAAIAASAGQPPIKTEAGGPASADRDKELLDAMSKETDPKKRGELYSLWRNLSKSGN